VVIRIGTSGWSYDHWRPELYPPGLALRDRLARYAAAFPAAELNSSFYPDLTWWADRIREWDVAGNDVFVYFNNDGNANAVRNARTLLALQVSGGASHPATSSRINS
jgi:uncharacterized protein YecE (DUF72 family)